MILAYLTNLNNNANLTNNHEMSINIFTLAYVTSSARHKMFPDFFNGHFADFSKINCSHFIICSFNEYLDLMYTVNGEKYEKHRALHLVNVTHHLSGSYMCKVNTFLNKIINKSIFIWRVFISIIRKRIRSKTELYT